MSYSFVLHFSQRLLRGNNKKNASLQLFSFSRPYRLKSVSYERMGKRLMDIVIALTALFFLWPVMLMVAIALKLTEDGPVLFFQERIGLDGRSFKCLKFRTMVVDAKEQLDRLLQNDPEAAREWRETQKLRNDPRITWLGSTLRKTSLDELPQFFNILLGDMSVVGPRPIVREELERYGISVRYYLDVRPGLTGLWQVSGRNCLDYQRRVLLDRFYVSKWSLLRDIIIIFRTPSALVRTGQTS